MKSTFGFLFFLLFLAGFALVSLQTRQSSESGELSADNPLAITEWRALRLFGNSVPDDVDMSVSFSGDGRLHGSAGCNRYSGRYEQSAQGFRVASMRATRKSCTDQIMALESSLFEVFRDARSSSLSDGDLQLLDADGGWLATFTAAELDPVEAIDQT